MGMDISAATIDEVAFMKGFTVLLSTSQVEKLLQKFMSSNVIEEVRGKLREFKEDPCYLYRFVTRPGPFNFVGDENSTPHTTPKKRAAAPIPSSLGKRKRRKDEIAPDFDGTWFANDYASTSADEESFSVCETGDTGESMDMVLGTPVQKKSRRSGCISASGVSSVNGVNSASGGAVASISNSVGGVSDSLESSLGSRTPSGGRGIGGTSHVTYRGCGRDEPPQALVAKVWKELTLNR